MSVVVGAVVESPGWLGEEAHSITGSHPDKQLMTDSPTSGFTSSRRERQINLSSWKAKDQKTRLKSRFHGVSQDGSGRWEAYVYASRKKIYLGNWDNDVEAAVAHDKATINIFGKNGSGTINFPLEDYKDELHLLGLLPQHQLVESLRADAKNKKRRSVETSPIPIAKSLKSNFRKHISSSLPVMHTEIVPIENSGVTRDSSLALTGPRAEAAFGLGVSLSCGLFAHFPGPLTFLEPLGGSLHEDRLVPASLCRSETPLPLVNEAEIGFGTEQGNICGMSDIDIDFGERKELLLGEPGPAVFDMFSCESAFHGFDGESLCSEFSEKSFSMREIVTEAAKRAQAMCGASSMETQFMCDELLAELHGTNLNYEGFAPSSNIALTLQPHGASKRLKTSGRWGSSWKVWNTFTTGSGKRSLLRYSNTKMKVNRYKGIHIRPALSSYSRSYWDVAPLAWKDT